MIINIKGLELQETSCHTVEAQYIDDAFDLAFENPLGTQANNSDCRTKFLLKQNPRPFNCMRPRDVLVFDAYSDAKSSLIGILDNPENINLLTNFYPKILHYFLVKYLFVEFSRESDSKSEVVSNKHENSVLKFRVTNDSFKNKTIESSTASLRKEENESIKNKQRILSINPDTSVTDSVASKKNVMLKNSKDDCQDDNFAEENNDGSDGWSENETINTNTKKNSINLSNKDEGNPTNSDSFDDFDLDRILGNAINSRKQQLPTKREEKMPSQFNSLFPSQDFAVVLQNTSQPLNKNEYENLEVKAIKQKNSILAINNEWLQFLNQNVNMPQSVTNETLKKALMSRVWLQKISDSYSKELKISEDREKVLTDFETNFWTSHYNFLLKCSQIMGVLNENSINANFNIQSIYKLYKGDLPWSPTSEKLNKEFPELKALLVKAFRYSIKMVVDSVSIYPITDDEEFIDTLKLYEKEWFIGSDNEPDFAQSILQNKPFLFSLCKDSSNVSLKQKKRKKLIIIFNFIYLEIFEQ